MKGEQRATPPRFHAATHLFQTHDEKVVLRKDRKPALELIHVDTLVHVVNDERLRICVSKASQLSQPTIDSQRYSEPVRVS